MTVANAKPDQIVRGPLGTATVNAASSAWWDVSTVEAKITEAIAYAVSIGAKAVYVPDCFLPYTASLVTFNPAVQMTREGGDPHVWDVHAYGAFGDGVTDDRPAINAADLNAPAGATVMFGAGKVYAIPTLTATTTLKAANAQTWDLNGSTIKYTGAATVTTGSDGGAIPLLAITGSNFILKAGTIDANSKVASPIALLDTTSGHVLQFITIKNLIDTTSSWLGIAYAISVDVTGQAIAGRAKNVSGFVQRPACAIVNAANTITGHADVSAALYGSNATWGNTTGLAICSAGGNETAQAVITCGTKGVPAFLSNAGAAITNSTFLDLICYDLGCRHQERYGAVLDLPQRQSFAGGGAYVPGWLDNTGGSDSIDHVITVTANVAVTVSNPTNPAAISVDRVGRLRFVIRNTSGGALTTPVTFNGTKYRVSGTVSPGNNQQIVVEVLWDQTNDTYIECFRSAAVAV